MTQKTKMSLSDFATPLAAKNDFIKASFGGFSGSGKTRTASEFVAGAYKLMDLKSPVLLIDNEKGSRFLIPFFKEKGIEVLVKDTIELADVLQAFKFLEEGSISFLFIDSLTKIWYKFIRDYKAKNRKTFMTIQDWGNIIPSWQELFADKLVEVEGNTVFTGRGGYSYDMEEDDRGKKQFIKSGVKMKVAGETPFEPDFNVWMDLKQEIDENGKALIHREALIMKDRSGLVDGKTFVNPAFDHFKPVVEYLISVDKGDVAGVSIDRNMAPSEEWDGRRKQREIVLEEIKGVFDGLAFGTSKEHRQIKVKIFEKVFNTSSWAKIETSPTKDLEDGLIILKDFGLKMQTLIESGSPVTLDACLTLLNSALEEFKTIFAP